MAVLPLNTFRTINRGLSSNLQTLYTCPTGVTAIILLAQVSNKSSATARVTFNHVRQGVVTPLVFNTPIPIEDALSVLTGRLVLEENDRITASATSTDLSIVLSLVESANA
jgi:hypothetical protein